MHGVGGKFMKKLKSIKPAIAYLNQDRILQAIALDGYCDFFTRNENFNPNVPIQKTIQKIASNLGKKNGDGVEDGETEESGFNDKENIEPFVEYRNKDSLSSNRGNCLAESKRETPLSEIDISSFRPPDMNSGTLFDPNLLEVFQQTVMEYMKIREEEIECRIKFEEEEEIECRIKFEEEEEIECRIKFEEEEEIECRIKFEEEEEEEEEEKRSSPFCFEEKCPPGGTDSVILYSTTLRGIRKTFEDCNSIRFLLETFKVKFHERDVSMHMEFKEELWRVLETNRALPPKLFIRGKYIGGAEEVLGLHEQGKLRSLFEGIPIDQFSGIPCEGCRGVRFVLCFKCNGSRKVVDDESDERRKCTECNENGLIICPYCC